MPFLDLSDISCSCTDHALEALHKAMADAPDGAGIWSPHETEGIRDTVEAFTVAGARIFGAIRRDVLKPISEIARIGKSAAWSIDEKALTERIRHLQRKAPRDYTLDDWMTLVDWIVLRYLPENAIRSQADFLTVRAALAAKIRAKMPESHDALKFEALLPTTIAGASALVTFTPMEQATLEVARTRAAELITNIGEQTRHRIKQLIIDGVGRRQTGERGATVQALERSISDEFAVLNRDWRRIAITETGNAETEGFIAALAPGSRVKRWEHYPTACGFCKGLHGKVFTVVDPADPGKDGATQVWVGKSNFGRSASPRKRVGDELVERTPEEMWWPAAGVQHPNCRGRWTVESDAGSPVDPKTKAFVDDLIKRAYGKPDKAPAS